MDPTPTSNDGLPYRRADFATLPEALDYAARGKTGYNFYSARGDLAQALTYAELRERAIDVARGFDQGGAAAGRAGRAGGRHRSRLHDPVLRLPVCEPARRSRRAADHVSAGARPMSRACGASSRMRGAAPRRRPPDALSLSARGRRRPRHRRSSARPGFLRSAARRRRSAAVRPGDRCYLQYSSGSTRAPLGVDVPQRVLMANATPSSITACRCGRTIAAPPGCRSITTWVSSASC